MTGMRHSELGQFVASQSVGLPEPYQVELARLDGNVPPVPASVIRAGIAAQLGQDVDQLFASFSDTALGSAFIGQVHAATLADGREVVVKVKKPGVDADCRGCWRAPCSHSSSVPSRGTSDARAYERAPGRPHQPGRVGRPREDHR